MAHANNHEYDCAINPLNFEFTAWLVQAEMIRRRHAPKAHDRLKIKFINTDQANRTVGREATGAPQLWLDEVMRPMLPMIGAVEDSNVECASYPFMSVEHIERDIADAARKGEEVPLLRADVNIQTNIIMNELINAKYEHPITITLRESSFWPHRNSNLDAWLQFAAYMNYHGEKVIFIRDYVKADEELVGFVTYPRASRELKYRMALYACAKMNFFVSNGPAMLVMFSPYPYIVIMTHYAGQAVQQRPWAGTHQLMVYRKDSYESILAAWSEIQVRELASWKRGEVIGNG